MKPYLDLVTRVLNGDCKESRNGSKTLYSFSESYKVEVEGDKWPLLTTKRVNWKAVIAELLWYLSGDDTITELKKHTSIWNPWADENDKVPSPYGYYWRNFNGEDQILNILSTLLTDPSSRRMVLSAWDRSNAWHSELPPCHAMAVFSTNSNRLNCHLTQRSGDIAIGIPFNLACYTLLMKLMAREVGMETGTFSHTIVDAHIYANKPNHIPGLLKQLERDPVELPDLHITPGKGIFDLTLDDFTLEGYNPHPPIKFEVLV